MGMLMHHTWLEQQKVEKPVAEVKTEEVKENKEPDAEPVRRTGGRRKVTK